MKQATVFLLLITLLLSSAKGERISSFLPYDINVLACLNTGRLRKNTYIKDLKRSNQEYSKFKEDLKQGVAFDLETVDKVYLVRSGNDNQFLVFYGNFNIDEIAAAVIVNTDLRVTEIEGIKFAFFLPDKGKKDVNMAVLIDNGTILFGGTENVQKALNVYLKKIKQVKGSARRKMSYFFRNDYDFSAFVIGWPWEADKNLRELTDTIDYFTFKSELNGSLKYSFEFELKKRKKAATFMQALEIIISNHAMVADPNIIKGIIIKELNENLNIDKMNNNVSLKSEIRASEAKRIVKLLNQKSSSFE